jgi:hypothetical protein
MKTKRNRDQPDARPPVPKADDPEQSRRFVEAARQIEADETGEAFRRAFEKIIPSKPPTR